MALSGHHQKRKEAPEAIDQPLAKKAKRSKTGKHIAGQDHDRNFPSTSNKKKKSEEFRTLQAHMTVNIPAVYTGPGRPRQAVLEMLDSILMQYVPSLQGVLLAHSNLEFASQTANFLVDSSFAKVDVSFQATVWSLPSVRSCVSSSTLSSLHSSDRGIGGTISICSPDHIGLLIHKTFNASIPRHHIPGDHWEFEYGSLENDPEYGAAAEEEEEQPREDGEERGRWVHKVTREMIGDGTKQLEFTIVGFNIADAMLSLIGSLQPDPFSPAHQPQPAASHFSTGINRRRSQYSIAEEESVANALMADDPESDGVVEPFTREQPSSEGEVGEESYDEMGGGGPLDDAFEQLGRETDKLSRELARDAKKSRHNKEEAEAARKEVERREKKERKRKRREERRLNGQTDTGRDEGPAKKKKKKDKGA